MSKPKIRRCECDGVVAIVAEIDFQEWWSYHHPRAVLVGKGSSDERRASPRFTMFFSDSSLRQELLGDLITGSRADCEELIRDCEVNPAYLFIPKFADPRHCFIPISLEAAANLIKKRFIPGTVPHCESIPEMTPAI